MGHLLRFCDPLKVFSAIVVLIAVNMVDRGLVFGVWNKCLCNLSVYVKKYLFAAKESVVVVISAALYSDCTLFLKHRAFYPTLVCCQTDPAPLVFLLNSVA